MSAVCITAEDDESKGGSSDDKDVPQCSSAGFHNIEVFVL
jgi:hypothetical protein